MALTRRRILSANESVAEPTKEDLLVDTVQRLTTLIEHSDTQARIQRLSLIATRPLSLLSTEQCKDLDAISKLSKEAYGSSAYSLLHAKITELFPLRIYAPLTVGSFFVGCLMKSNLSEVAPDVNPGCALQCGDGLPPADQPWGFCSQNVVWCVLSTSTVGRNAARAIRYPPGAAGSHLVRVETTNSDGPSFNFIFITYNPSSSKGILFVDYENYDSFPGFTKYEKAKLIHRMHITDVKLLSYDFQPMTTVYNDLLGKAMKVHQLKSRADPRDNETTAQRTTRRATVTKISSADGDEGPLTWTQAIALSFALLLLVILGVCAGFTVNGLRMSKAGRQ